MNVEKKAAEDCIVKMMVKADAAEIAAEYKKVENEYLRQASIPGFRKGKVPLAVVRQKFASGIKQDAMQACFQKLYPAALKEAGIEAVDLAGVEDVLFDAETGFSFTANVEVRPEFDLPKYKKLAIKANDTTVAEEAVDKQLADYRAAFAKYEDAKEGAGIADGDFVCFDYKGFCKGQPLSELLANQPGVSGEENHWVQIEEGRFLPEILAALKGMKVGENKEGVEVTFPKDNAPDAIKGKTCTYNITVKSFRHRELPDDKTFLEAIAMDSIDAARADIRTRLEKQAIAEDLENRRNQAIDLLLKKADFAVPPSLVRNQTQIYLKNLAQRAQSAGVPPDYIEKNRDQILADAETNAVRQVRLSYILEAISKAEEVVATDEDVEKGLEKIAAAQQEPTTAADVRARIEGNGQMNTYREQIKAEKTMDMILAWAK